MEQHSKDKERFFKTLKSGNVRTLARAITLVENDVSFVEPLPKQENYSQVIGFTGAPGVGKSTLINSYIDALRKSGRTVAVLCVDPSSPASGGAFLGDRLRMNEHIADPAVYIRSLSARSHLGGLCKNISQIIQVINYTEKWDIIILETVGAGQSEVEIAKIADCKIVVVCPGYGDEMQAMKAGILEIADILAVNKADMPEASHTAKELKSMLQLRPAGARNVPIILTVASQNQGIENLLNSIDALLN